MMMATAPAVAFVVFSCGNNIEEAEKLDLNKTPVQTVDDMFTVQTKNGKLELRVEAPRMERFDNDTCTMETFPDGFRVYSYNDEGLLETVLSADKAMHQDNKNDYEEFWRADGNVIIQNVINRQTMETDTLYWNQFAHEIYTDCYVRMYSPDGFMQGFGMRSDDKAQNATILKPFNSYGVVEKDTTLVIIDSVNFIGPFLKK